MPPNYDVTSDGRTVWVNGSSGLIARFGPMGIDIHQPADNMSDGHCLHCSHSRTSVIDWATFVLKVYEHFGIQIDPSHTPIAYAVRNEP